MAAAPVHAASSNAAVMARAARPPIVRRRPGTWTSPTAAGRNVISTGGTIGLGGRSAPARVSGFAAWRMLRASLKSSSSEGAIRATSGATTRTSCGSSVGFGFIVKCMGAPYSVQYQRTARRPADLRERTSFLPQASLRFDQSKAVRWIGEGRLSERPFGNPA